MATWDIATADAVLKKLYPDGVSKVLAPDCELFKKLKKDPKALVGKGRYVTVQHSGASGVSADLGIAIDNADQGGYIQFYVQPKLSYAAGVIGGPLMLAATEPGAIVNVLEEAVESITHGLGRSIAAQMYGDGSGSLGKIDASSVLTTDTIKLVNTSDAYRFETKMKVQAWSGSGSTLRNAGAAIEIKSVDYDAGTITATAPWNTVISAIATGDHLIRQGDFMNVAVGLAGWLPKTAPAPGDNFFGVDRSVNPSRLGGIRIAGSASIDETLMTAANKVAAVGGKPDFCVVNYMDFNEISLTRQSHLVIKDGSNSSTLGFESFKIMGPKGPIDVIPDSDCPQGTAYMLTSKSWVIGSAGDLPHIIDQNGSWLIPGARTDTYQMRMRGFWNLYTNAPGHNAVISFT